MPKVDKTIFEKSHLFEVGLFLLVAASGGFCAESFAAADIDTLKAKSRLKPALKPELQPSVTGYFAFPRIDFDVTDKRNGATTDFEQPEVRKIGASFQMDGYSFGFALPASAQERDGLPISSKQFDFAFSRFWDSVGIDAFYHENRGFYAQEDGQFDDEATARSDVYSRFVGTSFNYAIFQNGFSLQSLNSIDFESGTGSTGVLQASLTEFTLSADTELVKNSAFLRAQSRALNVGGGFAQQWIFGGGNDLANFGVMVGFGPLQQTIASRTESKEFVRNGQLAKFYGNYAHRWQEWVAGLRVNASIMSSDLGEDFEYSARGIEASVFGSRSF